MTAVQVRWLGAMVIGSAFLIAGSAIALVDAAAGVGLMVGGVVGSVAWALVRTVRP